MGLVSFVASSARSPHVLGILRAAGWALVAATAPLAVELLGLTAASWLPNRSRQPALRAARTVALTVVVPAHNEERLVARCVRSLRADLSPGGIVLVAAHNCSDRTAIVAAAAGAQVLVVEDDGHEGKGAALRAGFAHAVEHGATVLAVVDADSVVAPGFSRDIATALERGADAFQARNVVRNAGEESGSRLTALGFLGFNVVRPRGRARLGLSAGIFGNGFGLLSAVLEKVPYAASSLVEDLEYHLKLVDAGYRVHFLESATVSSEMPSSAAGASSQRARWEGGRLRMARLWLPRLLRGVLFRKQLRLVEPMLDLAGLPLATEVLLLTVAVLLPVPWLRVYAVSAFAVLLAHVATAAAEQKDWAMTARTLLSVPRYILWKLWMTPNTLSSARSNAAWIRTSRDAAQAPTHVAEIPSEGDRERGEPLRKVAG